MSKCLKIEKKQECYIQAESLQLFNVKTNIGLFKIEFLITTEFGANCRTVNFHLETTSVFRPPRY